MRLDYYFLLGCPRFRFRSSNTTGSEQVADQKQEEDEENERHDDDVMRDAGTDLQPTPFITHQEEKLLQNKTDNTFIKMFQQF